MRVDALCGLPPSASVLRSLVNPLDADLTKNNGGPWNNGGTCNPSGTTCGVHLHAVDSGAFYSGTEGKLGLKSLDSMLVSIGDPLPAPTPLVAPNPLGGVHFSLVDNTWNTNVSDNRPNIRTARPYLAIRTCYQQFLARAHLTIWLQCDGLAAAVSRMVSVHRGGDCDAVPWWRRRRELALSLPHQHFVSQLKRSETPRNSTSGAWKPQDIQVKRLEHCSYSNALYSICRSPAAVCAAAVLFQGAISH